MADLYTVYSRKHPSASWDLVGSAKTETAAIKRARAAAPYPPGGCFGRPEDVTGEAIALRGSVVFYRCRREPRETRRGLSTRVVEVPRGV